MKIIKFAAFEIDSLPQCFQICLFHLCCNLFLHKSFTPRAHKVTYTEESSISHIGQNICSSWHLSQNEEQSRNEKNLIVSLKSNLSMKVKFRSEKSVNFQVFVCCLHRSIEDSSLNKLTETTLELSLLCK